MPTNELNVIHYLPTYTDMFVQIALIKMTIYISSLELHIT